MNKASKNYGIMWKDLIYAWSANLNESVFSKLENTLQDINQENFPNLARQASIQV